MKTGWIGMFFWIRFKNPYTGWMIVFKRNVSHGIVLEAICSMVVVVCFVVNSFVKKIVGKLFMLNFRYLQEGLAPN